MENFWIINLHEFIISREKKSIMVNWLWLIDSNFFPFKSTFIRVNSKLAVISENFQPFGNKWGRLKCINCSKQLHHTQKKRNRNKQSIFNNKTFSTKLLWINNYANPLKTLRWYGNQFSISDSVLISSKINFNLKWNFVWFLTYYQWVWIKLFCW